MKVHYSLLPLTPTIGHYSSHWHQLWNTISPTDTKNGVLILLLTLKIGTFSSLIGPS
ncbi:unnamed protein product, partial [Staurois parvus]